ncbi:MAG: tyrosine-type recombinase/integrase [Candidatus Ranarchaeia archaeon]|jgi:site-specific recombinase XerD
MKNYAFQSCLEKRMDNFVALRCLAGTDYISQIKLLKYFDSFLINENYNAQFLTHDIIQRYFVNISYLHPRSQYNRFSIVRQFCGYLTQFEPLCYVPEKMQPAKSKSSYIPYIYTKAQIKSLLAEATNLSPQHSLRPQTYRTLFGLLYTTGLRIGETLGLDIKDFYPNSSRLHVREGKFHKARWVPLSSSTCTMIMKYINIRQQDSFITSDSPLFISLRYKRLHYSTVKQTFRSLLKQCNLHIGKGFGPRIHDLRHTFAVHRLLEWYRDGKDINARLPALATYMGHVSVRSTQVYLHATPELLQQANQRFLQHFRQNIYKGGQL